MEHKISTKRAEIANFAKSLGFLIHEADCDETFSVADFGSQYIIVKTPALPCGEFDSNGVEYTVSTDFQVRVSDHLQVSSCGNFAELCVFKHGEDFVRNQLLKISQNMLKFCDSGETADSF